MYIDEKNKFGGSTEPKIADPFTLESLIAWLRTKDADEAYDYWDCDRCLMAQYMQHLGYKPGSGNLHAIASNKFDFFTRARVSASCNEEEYTFGCALARAETLLASGRTP